jgi:membrane protease subunit HflK
MLQEAEAYKEKVIADSEGDADRFTKLLFEYKLAPKVTRDRLYIEAIESVYLNSNKVLMDSEGSGNLIYLPIDKLLEQNQSKQSNQPFDPNQSINTPSSQQNQNQDPRIRRIR